MIELTNEYKAIAKEYKRKFGYGVPLRMIPPTTTTKELIIRIKECIEKGDDDLLDTYGVTVEKSDLI